MFRKIVYSSVICASLFVFSVQAQEQGAGTETEQQTGQSNELQTKERGHKKRRPPREAIEACSKSTSGESCSFTGLDGSSHTGTCLARSSDKPLACRPQKPN